MLSMLSLMRNADSHMRRSAKETNILIAMTVEQSHLRRDERHHISATSRAAPHHTTPHHTTPHHTQPLTSYPTSNNSHSTGSNEFNLIWIRPYRKEGVYLAQTYTIEVVQKAPSTKNHPGPARTLHPNHYKVYRSTCPHINSMPCVNHSHPADAAKSYMYLHQQCRNAQRNPSQCTAIELGGRALLALLGLRRGAGGAAGCRGLAARAVNPVVG